MALEGYSFTTPKNKIPTATTKYNQMQTEERDGLQANQARLVRLVKDEA